MLKTLGRSVYLTQFEEQRASLSAFAAGGAPVFISLHISEEFDAAYCARVQEMCDFLAAQGWRILADVSEKTIRQFGCADLTALAKRLHLWGLRLDYGFSLEQMCALAQQLPVAVNASTTTPEVARQLAAGGGTVIAMHNFYPRPETGLDPEFLRESTAALQAEGLQVYGFIPGDALLRGPLYKGLPTLEAHRTAKQVRKQRRRAALENAFRRRVESKLEILANIAQALEKTRTALDDGIDEPGEQELAKHREELDALIAAVRQREAQVRTRSIQRYETALRVLRANPSAKAKAELGEAFDSLRKLLEK